MDDVPAPDEEQCNKEFAAIIEKHMPDSVRDVYHTCPEWLDTRTANVTADSNVVGYRDCNEGAVYLRYYWNRWGQECLPDEARDYIAKLEDILTQRIKFKQKLGGIISSITTVKALKEALPELEKYAPDDTPEPKTGLPAVANLMADVIAAGWPGGKIVNAEVQPA
jgi:hypothetical protein